MPSRITPFFNGQIYHIFNRGTEKRAISENNRDRQRFLETINYYQFSGPKPKFSHYSPIQNSRIDSSQKIVEIICFCLMPNHFHLLVRQLKEGGITEFISKLTNSYTKYYNIKYNRVGPLFQGEFKSVLVESDEQLVHVSRYIHLNPLTSFLVKDLKNYQWSSYPEYLDTKKGISVKEPILNYFQSIKEYQKFIQDQAEYAQSLEIIKHQRLED